MTQQPQGQPQGQQFNNQQYGGQPQGQQGYAPSAYSAPQPGYGQPQFQNEPSAFGSLFSTNFDNKVTAPLAKLVMLLGVIAFGIFAGYALFDMLAVVTADHAPAMVIITGIINFIYRVAIAFVLLGVLRILLEYFVDADKKGTAGTK